MSPISAALLVPGQPVMVDGRVGEFVRYDHRHLRAVVVRFDDAPLMWKGPPDRVQCAGPPPVDVAAMYVR